MLKKKKPIKFGDKVRVVSGFYEGQIAVMTYFCPETGCICGYVDGDGTDQMHYFFEDQLELIDRGYYFQYEESFEDYEPADLEPKFTPKILKLKSKVKNKKS